MSSSLKITHIKKSFLMARNAEPAPPLGTILGNLGVNTVKFCEEFNNITKNLPNYFQVKTTISIYENRSFKFLVNMPSTGFFLNLLKFEKVIKIRIHDRFHDKSIYCIKLNDVIKLALFKFPKINLNKSVPIIWGSIKSMNLIVIK